MQNARPALAILFSLACSACDLAAVRDASKRAPTPFDRNRMATVMVLNKYDIGASLGTGVVVDTRGLVLTNRHVIEDKFDAQKQQTRAGTPLVCEVKGLSLDCLPARIVITTEKHDVALLQVDRTFPYAIEIADDRDLEEGAVIYARCAVLDLLPPSLVYGRFIGRADPRWVYAPFKVPVLVLDISANPAGSGGGIFDRNGRMVGLARLVSPPPGRPNLIAVPGSVLKALVEKYNPFTKAAESR